MKINHFLLFTLASIVIIFAQCNTEKPLDPNTFYINGTIKGLEDAVGMRVNLDELEMGKNTAVANVELGKDGHFEFEVPVSASPKLYRLRSSNISMFVSNENGTNQVELNADAKNPIKGNYTVKGSPASSAVQTLYEKVLTRKASANDFKILVEQNMPYAAAYMTQKYLPVNTSSVAVHNLAISKLKQAHPTLPLVQAYTTDLSRKVRQMSGGKSGVKVGQVAPDIKLPNPDGEMMQLSSLKGKVVVVDFWASWCGPCRRYGNPKLVELNKKYGKDDFAIFNVALERGQNNKRWIDAIEKDGLTWPHQVVDTKREFSPIYGASRIPRVYLVDKAGKIAAINPQGAELDNKIKELLKG